MHPVLLVPRQRQHPLHPGAILSLLALGRGGPSETTTYIYGRHCPSLVMAPPPTRLDDTLWEPPNGTMHEPLDQIFWAHVPKTGSTFLHTILSYSCKRTMLATFTREGKQWQDLFVTLHNHYRRCAKLDCCPFNVAQRVLTQGSGQCTSARLELARRPRPLLVASLHTLRSSL